MLEPAAGMIRENETPQATVIRELREETGYQVSHLAPIATFFVSPGGTSERIFLFYAEVRRTDQAAAGGGEKGEGEDIKIVRMPISEFFARLRNQELEDAKLIIAAQWLKERRATQPIEAVTIVKPIEYCLKSSTQDETQRGPKRIIGYMSGDILNVRGVEVWVNPLTTDMLLDRFADRTVSAAIRRRGAERYPDNERIKYDTIGEELRRAMGGRNFVRPAKVIDTSSGELFRSNDVKRIFHVAVSKGEIGDHQGVDPDTIDQCMDNVLEAIERSGRYSSALFPMMGTGPDGLPVNQVAPRLVRRSIAFFQERPKARLQKVYFLAYSEVDADVLADVMKSFEKNKYLETAAPPVPVGGSTENPSGTGAAAAVVVE
jgi:ADP-ribose pyrophosphatase